MTDEMRQIALRIWELRDGLDKTQEQVAAETGVLLKDYQSYEEGRVDIPISFLLKLEQNYGVDPTTILTGEAPRLSVCAVTRNDMGVLVTRAHHYVYKNLAYNFNHRKIEPLLVTVSPGVNEELETNSHAGHEFDYVLSGSLRLIVGDNDIVLNAGDSAYYDSIHPHAMQAAGDEPCQFLAMVIP
ncbi:cupin domain-containing protein [Eubacteriales bacterium OttesenSCG-928-N13]|nr:cupin domain-containing protein [Eubacteriales bacterium OttesenSCG-928-N13]